MISPTNEWQIEVIIGGQRAVLFLSDGRKELGSDVEMASRLLDAASGYIRAVEHLEILSCDPGIDHVLPGRMS